MHITGATVTRRKSRSTPSRNHSCGNSIIPGRNHHETRKRPTNHETGPRSYRHAVAIGLPYAASGRTGGAQPKTAQSGSAPTEQPLPQHERGAYLDATAEKKHHQQPNTARQEGSEILDRQSAPPVQDGQIATTPQVNAKHLSRDHPQIALMHQEEFGTIEIDHDHLVFKIHLTKHTTRFTRDER